VPEEIASYAWKARYWSEIRAHGKFSLLELNSSDKIEPDVMVTDDPIGDAGGVPSLAKSAIASTITQ